MTGVDLDAIARGLLLARIGFVALSLLFAWRLAKAGRPVWWLAFTLAANAFVWVETNAPLARPYALGASHDRAGNVQLAAVIAAGRPFYESAQLDQYTFEPGWGVVAALASGFDPERLVRIYPLFSLAAPVLVALGIWFGTGGRASGLDGWERAAAAYCGTLLVSRPIDFSEFFSDPWAMMFLLKPNHALGLALAPVFLRLQAEAQSLPQRLRAALVLSLIGWLCVFHMVFLWAALVSFVVLGPLEGRAAVLSRIREAAPAFGVSAVLTSPYLFVLLFRFPAGQAGPRFGNPASEALLLWPTFQAGLVFVAAVGGVMLWRRRLVPLPEWWRAVIAGGLVFWVLLLLLGYAQRARERDELLYWLRFWFAITAGAMLLEGFRRVENGFLGRSLDDARRAALIVAVSFPFTVAAWWAPPRMDRYFTPSLEPIPGYLRAPGEYLIRNSRPEDVVAGDPVFAKFVSVFGGRRVFLSENLNNAARALAERTELQRLFVGVSDGREACAFAAPRGIRFLLATTEWLRTTGVTLDALRSREHLTERLRVLDAAGEPVVLFEVNCGQGSRP